MKIVSNKTLNKMIQEAVSEAKKQAYDKGYKEGLHKGLTSEKEGIHLNNNGIYVFNDETSKSVFK